MTVCQNKYDTYVILRKNVNHWFKIVLLILLYTQIVYLKQLNNGTNLKAWR